MGESVCGDCGRPVELIAGQSAFDGLRWWASYTCAHCGRMIEMDGWGIPEASFREAFLRADGTWGLKVHASGSQAVLALKLLRAEMGLSLVESGRLRDRMTGVVTEGTLAEIQHLQQLLGRSGVETSRIRLDAEHG
ncbi:hypothetical protein OV208_28725 [Corallococcus sp. bb12-1]|uniref:hypothetical protein n=1 Tax=Corallococcus sp. bb12-1 TaxID=2996784 RepID=UPI0022705CF4|nr:hypothetical protein [Corallococcus sp. bb12-1]MCY1045335.1 hypothetical protein [Corallococcus sp. bb12-1]